MWPIGHKYPWQNADWAYLELTAESTTAVLEGLMYDGIGIWDSDAVRIRAQGQGAPAILPTPALAPTVQPPGQ